jgi:hypothetical protein
MKRILPILLLLLVACSNEEDETTVPETVDDDYRVKPPTVVFTYSWDVTQFSMFLDNYCWQTNEASCDLTPTDPDEWLDEKRYIRVEPEATVEFQFTQETRSDIPFIDALFYPDEIMLLETRSTTGEQREIELDQLQFTSPEQRGRHFYTLIATWDNEEIRGEAIYGMTLNVIP